MRVLVSGASGLIGRAVSALLRSRNHEVHALVRLAPTAGRDAVPLSHTASSSDLPWKPDMPLDPAKVGAFDAIVHLAGRSVATRWTEKTKAEIRNSRVAGTANVARAAALAFQAGGKPHALICASAIGYYGSRGDEALVEGSEAGLGFLAEVCREWEQAASPAAMAGVRVAHMRTSMVLSDEGGALAKMLPAFRLGMGGRIGSGRQWWSWVSLNDAARAYAFAVENETVHGALNLAAPKAVTNSEFTRTLGRVLHRPALLPVPAMALRAAAGDMAEEILLSSQRVIPRRLLEAGFEFDDIELEPTLRKLLD